MRRGALIIGAVLLLAACGKAEAPLPPTPTAAEALELKPADPRLAELYEVSCKACHAIPGTGAPLVHDREAWAPRWKKGEDALIDNVILGYNGMPPSGQCGPCTIDDYGPLIRFMAGREDSAK